MTLYRKHGGEPRDLPAVDYSGEAPDRLSWSDLANNPDGLEACGYAVGPARPDYDPATHVCVWNALAEAWRLDALPPIAEPEITAPPPIRIGKFWLFERFTEDQEMRFAKLESQVSALSASDLDDPANAGLFQLSRFLRRLSALSLVELDAPGTLASFELLRLLGVFGDPASPASAEAMAAILVAPSGRELEGAGA